MFRLVGTSFALLIAAAEPLMGDTDIVHYGVTQGGLFIVVVILLVWGRREFRRQLADEKERTMYEQTRNEEHRQMIATLVALVGTTNTSMQQTCAVGHATEQAIHRLAGAVERWDGSDRRGRG